LNESRLTPAETERAEDPAVDGFFHEEAEAVPAESMAAVVKVNGAFIKFKVRVLMETMKSEIEFKIHNQKIIIMYK